VYLFSEIRRDIDKLVVEKKVEAKVEQKQEKILEVKKVESKEVKITSTSKWITPSNSMCKNNGGKVNSGGCNATWSNAKNICSASGGSLPSIDALRRVVTDCGGTIDDYSNNLANSSYQSCYKQKGFSSYWYWSKTSKDSSSAWLVHFKDGDDLWNGKTYTDYVLCVSGQ
jgi:hypothetical protein